MASERKLWPWIVVAVLLAAGGGVFYQWNATKSQPVEESLTTNEPAPPTAVADSENESPAHVVTTPTPAPAAVAGYQEGGQKPLIPPATEVPTAPPADMARAEQLAAAISRGDQAAFDELAAISKAAHLKLKANVDEFQTQQEKEEFTRNLFAPVQAALDALGVDAINGNQYALDAIAKAAQTPELQGIAVKQLGKLAGAGSEAALEPLLHPDAYGIHKSSAVFALKPAADNNNAKAIEALAQVAADQKSQSLWYAVADGLEKAAASGNDLATDTLISLLTAERGSIRNRATKALRVAAQNQNQKAFQALQTVQAP